MEVANKHRKDAQQDVSSGNCKLKQQWDTTTEQFFKGQNPRHWHHHMLARTCSSRSSHSLLVGMENGTAIVEDHLAVSSKTKHTLSMQSNNHAHRHLPKGAEDVCPHESLHTDVHSGLIRNFAKTQKQPRWPLVGEYGATPCGPSRQWAIYSIIKGNELSSYEQTWRKPRCLLLSENQPVWEGCLLYDFKYMTL